MPNHEKVLIDRDLCTGCGDCAKVCPLDVIIIRDNKAETTERRCILCGHCYASCPSVAIRLDMEQSELDMLSAAYSPQYLEPGKGDFSMLYNLIRSRRSCRSYTERELDRVILSDLVKTGQSAPSGTNSQKWVYTVVNGRDKVERIADAICGFFSWVNHKAEKGWLRFLTRLFGRKSLSWYYERYYMSVKEAIDLWKTEKRDLLFHGAPALIIISSRPGASTPADDCFLAAQNIQLAAHALGLGSCLIGYAVQAIERSREVKAICGVPDEETVYTVITLGYPDEKYRRFAPRKVSPVREL